MQLSDFHSPTDEKNIFYSLLHWYLELKKQCITYYNVKLDSALQQNYEKFITRLKCKCE